MSNKKPTAAEKAALEIRRAAAKAICGELIPKYGVGYRLSDLLNKVRELTNNRLLMTKEFLGAVSTWLKRKVLTFNNRYVVVTPKGFPHIKKLAPA